MINVFFIDGAVGIHDGEIMGISNVSMGNIMFTLGGIYQKDITYNWQYVYMRLSIHGFRIRWFFIREHPKTSERMIFLGVPPFFPETTHEGTSIPEATIATMGISRNVLALWLLMDMSWWWWLLMVQHLSFFLTKLRHMWHLYTGPTYPMWDSTCSWILMVHKKYTDNASLLGI